MKYVYKKSMVKVKKKTRHSQVELRNTLFDFSLFPLRLLYMPPYRLHRYTYKFKQFRFCIQISKRSMYGIIKDHLIIQKTIPERFNLISTFAQSLSAISNYILFCKYAHMKYYFVIPKPLSEYYGMERFTYFLFYLYHTIHSLHHF